MIVAATAVVAVWIALFGTAYVSRGLGRVAAIGAVTACYLAAASLALHWLGGGVQGRLAAAGMLVPYGAAIGLTIISTRR